jgi:predicted ATP-grasp superfamily ATP-dependent carboligase
MRETLTILGASARAAAQSAVRAGFDVWAADLFADADLRACGDGVQVHAYPRGLERALAQSPPGEWIYTGALENHPRLIQRMASSRRLLGCASDAVRRVRDPRRLSEVVRSAGLLFPETRFDGFRAKEAGQWLVKSFRSAGGMKVRFAEVHDRQSRSRRSNYFQRFIEGLPCSAVYIAAGGRSLLLGATRQLVGCDWTGGSGFQYCGSIGPLALNPRQLVQVDRLGECIAGQFPLAGLFGVDFVLAGDDVWALEVNPRYTASVEVIERSLGIRAVASHVAACRDARLVVETGEPRADDDADCVSGKAIVFARTPLTILPSLTEHLLALSPPGPLSHFADIPAPGTKVMPRQPVFTCFAEGPGLPAVEAALRTVLLGVEQHLVAT